MESNKEKWEDHWFNLGMFQMSTEKLIGAEAAENVINAIQEALDTEMDKYLGLPDFLKDVEKE